MLAITAVTCGGSSSYFSTSEGNIGGGDCAFAAPEDRCGAMRGAGLRSALASRGWVCRGRERVFAGSNIDGCTLLRQSIEKKKTAKFFWPPSPRLFGEKHSPENF